MMAQLRPLVFYDGTAAPSGVQIILTNVGCSRMQPTNWRRAYIHRVVNYLFKLYTPLPHDYSSPSHRQSMRTVHNTLLTYEGLV